jgi:membrane peptidoglycan carboxypeptidase
MYQFVRPLGVKNLALQIYAKEFDKLNERELASIIIMMKNPIIYNPRKKNRLK